MKRGEVYLVNFLVNFGKKYNSGFEKVRPLEKTSEICINEICTLDISRIDLQRYLMALCDEELREVT